ncbi:MAG: hypothetical protein IT297_09275 [Anaerolineae bacterium]|nr:hypothetical protein [Anaerolineae bacterium]
MERKTAYIVLLSWIISVMPLTWLGYGSDGDAWSVAKAAKTIYLTRQYVRSRSTGFPLFEVTVTPLVNIGQWYLSNLLPLLFGIMIFMALIRLSEKGVFRHPKITLFSFMFLPVMVKNATSTMDYLPALALLIWAYVCLIEHRWVVAGLLIGIACGFRPTSALFVIPATIYTYIETKKSFQVFQILLISFISGVIAYSPALFKYGISIPYGSIKLDQQTMILITGYNFLRLFGIVQSLVLMVCFAVIIQQIIINKNFTSFFLFHITNILVWAVLFLFLPDEPEYLLPMIPSVIFILDRYLSRKIFLYVSLILLSYHIIQVDALGGRSGDRYIKVAFKNGFTVRDIQDRVLKLSIREAANKYVTSTKTVLMYGKHEISAANDLWTVRNGMDCQRDGNLCVSGRIRDEQKLETLHLEGFRLVVWRGEMWEYSRTGTSLPSYVEVIDSLSSFFGVPIYGKALTQ